MSNCKISPLYALAVLLPFATCSCASITQPTVKTHTSAASINISDNTPNSIAQISSANDNSISHWAKERLNYLRSLDYAKIAQQNNPQKKYMLKASLIESRYDLKNAEIALYDDRDNRTAMIDLKDALQRYKHAAKLADTKELPTLGNTEQRLEALVKSSDQQVRCRCDSTKPVRYHRIEAKIENLLATL